MGPLEMNRTAIVTIAWLLAEAMTSPVFADCTCAENKLKGGWCTECKVGHIASVRIESEALFEFLDAHGHHINPATIRCKSCVAAIKSDGFCDRCGMGYVDELAYLSVLTYSVAKGKPLDPAKIECRKCAHHAKRFGWCESCKVGMIGNVAIRDKHDYERAAKAMQKLLIANETAKRCETCAIAIVADATCPKCKITYKNGVTSPPADP